MQRATSAFTVQGKEYPAGSYVVQTAQAFRPHVMDMFEPQVHPDVFPIPGGPPTPPYDNAGWTLAFQMGVQFDRVLDPFTGPFEPIDDWNIAPPAGHVTGVPRPAGYLTSRRVNNAFIAMNRLLAAGEEVRELREPMTVGGQTWPAGTFYVRSRGTTRAAIDRVSNELGVSFAAVAAAPPPAAPRLAVARVGLWDQYGGSIDAGWARWILEQYDFPFERVFAPALDAGNLRAKYDVLVFVGGGIPAASGGGRGGGMPDAADVPAQYRSQLGRVTVDRTLPQVRTFIEEGGTVIAIGTSATNLATFLQLPVGNHLVENGAPMPPSRFYTPGSLLTARFDTTSDLTWGMAAHTDVFFDNSPVFRLQDGAAASGVERVGWFDTAAPLHSGWSWGQSALENGVVAVSARVGKGRVILYGPEILQRAQPHATFKLLFNGIVSGALR